MPRSHWYSPVVNPPSPPDPPLPPPDVSNGVQKRVFVLECEIRPSHEAACQFRKHFEEQIHGTELQGSGLLILSPGYKLSELTGEGLPKVRVDSEGKLVFLTEGEA